MGSRKRRRLVKSKISSSNTEEGMDRSGSAAKDSVEMISIIKEGESNEITTNSIGLEDASGLNSFQPLIDGCHT